MARGFMGKMLMVDLSRNELNDEALDSEYLTAMDWNLKTAKPSEKKLQELDMADVAQVLWP